MRYLLFLIAAVLIMEADARAQGFQDEPTCYSWSGGHKSAGSFSKCGSELQPLKKPAPPPAPVVTPVAAAPVVIKETIIQECPKPVPQNKPVFIKKRAKPKPPECK